MEDPEDYLKTSYRLIYEGSEGVLSLTEMYTIFALKNRFSIIFFIFTEIMNERLQKILLLILYTVKQVGQLLHWFGLYTRESSALYLWTWRSAKIHVDRSYELHHEQGQCSTAQQCPC